MSKKAKPKYQTMGNPNKKQGQTQRQNTRLYAFRLNPFTKKLLDYCYDRWFPRGYKTWDRFLLSIAETLVKYNEDLDDVKRYLKISRQLNTLEDEYNKGPQEIKELEFEGREQSELERAAEVDGFDALTEEEKNAI